MRAYNQRCRPVSDRNSVSPARVGTGQAMAGASLPVERRRLCDRARGSRHGWRGRLARVDSGPVCWSVRPCVRHPAGFGLLQPLHPCRTINVPYEPTTHDFDLEPLAPAVFPVAGRSGLCGRCGKCVTAHDSVKRAATPIMSGPIMVRRQKLKFTKAQRTNIRFR